MVERLEERVRSLTEEIAEVRARLAEVAAAISRDGVVVDGSQGQPRPHGLLTVERGLRRDRFWLERELFKLEEQLDVQARVQRANAIFAGRA